MKLYERLTVRDKIKLFAMWFFTVAGCVMLDFFRKIDLSRMVLTGFFGVLFFCAFAFLLVHEFTLEESKKQLHETVTRMMGAYLAGLLLVLLSYLCPLRIHVILAVSGVFSIIVPPIYGLLLALFLSTMVGMNLFLLDFEMGYVVFLCLMGVMLSPILRDRRFRVLSAVLVGAMSVTTAFLFAYIQAGKICFEDLYKGGAECICNVIIVVFFLPVVMKKRKEKEVSTYIKAMQPDYPLAAFMRSLSEERFMRCQFVAKICVLCARQVSYDENLCACAGFYYDLCDNDEPDSIEYATGLGKNNLLPIEVVRIMSQFHGEMNPISTREAALVDLVYETVLSLERLQKDAEDFEKEMAVHTVFNNLSKNGRYDVSGLSMNHFLTLRNYLIKEVDHL